MALYWAVLVPIGRCKFAKGYQLAT